MISEPYLKIGGRCRTGNITINAGDRLHIQTPGGGAYGALDE